MKHLDLFLHEEAARCLLCENAPCSKACGKGDPARAIRAIRFNNEKNAWRWLDDCSDEDLQKAADAAMSLAKTAVTKPSASTPTPVSLTSSAPNASAAISAASSAPSAPWDWHNGSRNSVYSLIGTSRNSMISSILYITPSIS